MAKPDAGPWYKVLRIAAVLVDPRRRRRRLRLVQGVPCRGAGGLRRRGAVAAGRALRRARRRSGSSTARSGRRRISGIPYPIFHVLPRVFGDLLPGPGGYRAFGIPWEEGRELPVGFSKKTMGFPRITQTCAICHAASYRIAPDATPVIVPTRAVAYDQRHGVPRFSGSGGERSALVGGRDDAGDRAELRPEARRQAGLSLPDHPDREEAGAGAGGGLRLDPYPRARRRGGRGGMGRSI